MQEEEDWRQKEESKRKFEDVAPTNLAEKAGESETDDESSDEDDYGPSPAAGVWAGTQKLEDESQAFVEDSTDEDDIKSRQTKKIKITE